MLIYIQTFKHYLMTLEQKLVERTLAAGSYGLKKTDLRKEFGEPFDAALQSALEQGTVFMEKRGGAYYCWHKKYYIQSLLNSDPRFRLTYDMLRSLEESVNASTRQMAKSIEVLSGNISNLANLVTSGQEIQQESPTALKNPRVAPSVSTLSASDFQKEFDTILANNSSSIGWVELAKIKSDLCERHGLSSEEFYRRVSEVTLQQQNKYELSTGGGEGVMVRGLLHGFVRCI